MLTFFFHIIITPNMNMKNIVAFLLVISLSSSHGLLPIMTKPATTRQATFALNLFGHRENNRTPAVPSQTTNATSHFDEPQETVVKKGYQRVEDWDAERNAKGEMSWEERVQFEGQRLGNQVRQNDILMRHLHTF